MARRKEAILNRRACVHYYLHWFISQLCEVTLGFDAAIREQIYFG